MLKRGSDLCEDLTLRVEWTATTNSKKSRGLQGTDAELIPLTKSALNKDSLFNIRLSWNVGLTRALN